MAKIAAGFTGKRDHVCSVIVDQKTDMWIFVVYVLFVVAGLEIISAMTEHLLDTTFFVQSLDMTEEIVHRITHVAAVLFALPESIHPMSTPAYAMIVQLVPSRISPGPQSAWCVRKDSPAIAALLPAPPVALDGPAMKMAQHVQRV